MATDNSANRLLKILEPTLTHQNHEQSRSVWASVFDVQAEDRIGFMHRYSGLLNLCRQVREEVKRVADGDDDVYLAHFGRIENAIFTSPLDGTWNRQREQLTEAAMHGLLHCARLLSRKSPEPLLDGSALVKMQAELNEFLSTVLTLPDLDEPFRRFLVVQIGKLITAIADYKVGGFKAVQEAVESAVGSILLRPEIGGQVKKTTVGKAWWEWLARVAATLSIAANTAQLADYEMRQLPDFSTLSNPPERVVPNLPSSELPHVALLEYVNPATPGTDNP